MKNFILSDKKTKIVRYDMNAYITGLFETDETAAENGVYYKAGELFPSNDEKAIGIVLSDYCVFSKKSKDCDYPPIDIVRAGAIKVSALPELPTTEAVKMLENNISFKLPSGGHYSKPEDTEKHSPDGNIFENFDFTKFKKIDVFYHNGNQYQIENEVIYNSDKTTLVYCNPEKEGEFTAPNSLKNIGYKAFSRTNLSYIVLNNGLETIGEKAFERFDDISHTVVIPKTVSYISSNAFRTFVHWHSMAGSMKAVQDHNGINANIIIYNDKDSISGAPWGSRFADVIWRPVMG